MRRFVLTVVVLNVLLLGVLLLPPVQADTNGPEGGVWYARRIADTGPAGWRMAGALCDAARAPCYPLQATVEEAGLVNLSTETGQLAPQVTWRVSGMRVSEPSPTREGRESELPLEGQGSGDGLPVWVGDRVLREQVEGAINRAQAVALNGSEILRALDGENSNTVPIALAGAVPDAGALLGAFLAPSQDGTDGADVMSLYVLGHRGLVELAYQAPADVMPLDTATASLVQTTDTWQWDPPSPDPAGITYLPATNRLLISDSEVVETDLYDGSNLFLANLSGSLADTDDTTGFSSEPTGVTVNSENGHLFFSDDDQDTIFELTGLPSSGMVTATIDTSPSGNEDPEGVAYDSGSGALFVVDGSDSEVYRYHPGPDGTFGNGNDTVTSFDVGSMGVSDPEGIAYDADTDHLLVLDSVDGLIVEITTSGELVREIDISAANPLKAAGLVLLPPSGDPSVRTLYVVDRRADNDDDPTENDGLLFEFEVPAYVELTPTPTNTNTPTISPTDSSTPTETTTNTPPPTATNTSTPSNTPIPSTTATATATSTQPPSATPLTLPTDTPTATPEPTPTATEEVTPSPTPTGTGPRGLRQHLTIVLRASHDPLGEENDTCSQAFPMALNREYRFLPEDGDDWYRFTLTEKAEVTVRLSHFAPRQGQIAAYFGESCGVATFLKNDGSSSTEKVLVLGSQQAGTYYVYVSNDGRLNDEDHYSLIIETE